MLSADSSTTTLYKFLPRFCYDRSTVLLSRSLILKKSRGFQGPPQRQAPNIIQQKLQQALALQQRGLLSDAKKIYEDILQEKPNHFDALHLLGVIAYRTKNLHQAAELIGKAIT